MIKAIIFDCFGVLTSNDLVANDRLFGYIATKLKPEYKIGMLSNTAADWLDELFTPEQIKMFDNVVLSFKTGYVKPDRQIFEQSCRELGVKPEEAVMVDDIERFAAAAEDIGMKAIAYTTFEDFKAKLEKILGIDNQALQE